MNISIKSFFVNKIQTRCTFKGTQIIFQIFPAFGHKKIWQIPIFTWGVPILLSAITCLTSVFGMGTGVTTYTSSPEMFCVIFSSEVLNLSFLYTTP